MNGGIRGKLLGACVRWRWPLLLTAGLALGLTGTGYPPDGTYFATFGHGLVTGHLSAVYGDPANQSGPLQLVACYLFMPRPSSSAGAVLLHLLGNVVIVAGVLLATRWVRRLLGLAPSSALELALGLVVVGWIIPGSLCNAHLSEVAIPVLWVGASYAVLRGRPVLAGALLAAATGMEPWGVLAVPVLLIDPRPSRLWRSAGACVASVAVMYVPFALSGHFALFSHRWPIGSTTLVHALWPHATTFSWSMRLLQAVLSAGACAFVALSLRRRSVEVVWLAPVAAVLARLLVDPTQFDYYWVTVILLSICGVAACTRAMPVADKAARVALLYLPFLRIGDATVPVCAASIVAALVVVVRARRAGAAPADARAVARTPRPQPVLVPAR